MQHITIADLKSANLAALANRSLGFHTNPGRTCRYTYDNDSHCAIGVALNAESLAAIAARDLNSGNSPGDLEDEDICSFENLAVARISQRLHDLIAFRDHLTVGSIYRAMRSEYTKELPGHLSDFLSQHGNDTVDEAFFKKWIEAL